MDNERAIRNKLAAIGEDYNSISDNLKQYLFSIQRIYDRKVEEQRAAIQVLQDNDLSVSGVCAELKMSRNTAYRHGSLLQRYIEYSASQLASTNPLLIGEKLRHENTEKQKQLHLMLDRDIDMLQLKNTISQRDRLLREKEMIIEQKKLRIMELTRDCQQLNIEIDRIKQKRSS